MLHTFNALIRDEEGATMVEYALMVALIAAVSVGIVTTLGQSVSKVFAGVNTAIQPAI